MQLIARRGAQGKNLKEFLKLIELEEKAFRNPNGHGKGNRPSMEPIAPNFIRPEAQTSEPAGEQPREGGGLTHNGEEYA